MKQSIYKIVRLLLNQNNCYDGFLFLLLLTPIGLVAQNNESKPAKIEILHANSLQVDEELGNGAKRLIGNVKFKHDNAIMNCDSAHFYSEANKMDAYGRIRVNQGDSLQLYGDSLNYDGNTKKALLRGNIRLINKEVTLNTKMLDYDRKENLAYYYGGGRMVNTKENQTLTSNEGYYHSTSRSFFFKDSVVLVNPQYVIHSDTLKYNSFTRQVDFFGPTTITSDKNFIYCENGWYNTNTNISKFYNNSYLYSREQIIKGDTLYYERDAGYGEILCNAEIIDTVENITISGDIARIFELKDSVMITEEALLTQYFDKDTLYMHADTFKIATVIDSINGVLDTNRMMYAYFDAQFYRNDMQGKADSIIYNFSDSIISFYHDPIIWSEENQLTADFIYILTTEDRLHSIYLEENAFIISHVDSTSDKFNQIKGKNMIGYFKGEELHKILVNQNAETIYYGRDEKLRYVGVNKAFSDRMLIFIENSSIKTLTYIDAPEATLYPLKDVSPKEVILKGFSWHHEKRPKDLFDLFVPK